jgi:hypothetical protein
MRHVSPTTVTILLSSFPEAEAAAHAILSQSDDILLKPPQISALTEVVTTRVPQVPGSAHIVETVATILDRSAQQCIEEWFEQAQDIVN